MAINRAVKDNGLQFAKLYRFESPGQQPVWRVAPPPPPPTMQQSSSTSSSSHQQLTSPRSVADGKRPAVKMTAEPNGDTGGSS